MSTQGRKSKSESGSAILEMLLLLAVMMGISAASIRYFSNSYHDRAVSLAKAIEGGGTVTTTGDGCEVE